MCIWLSAEVNVDDENDMWFFSPLQMTDIAFSLVYYHVIIFFFFYL